MGAQHPGEHDGCGKVVMILLAACARRAPSAGEYAAAIRALARHGGTIKKCALWYKWVGDGKGTADVQTEYVNLLNRTVLCESIHALTGACQVSE